MINEAVVRMAEITDPDELVSFMVDAAHSYRNAEKPKTRMSYAILILVWALIAAVGGIAAHYWLAFFVETGLITLS